MNYSKYYKNETTLNHVLVNVEPGKAKCQHCELKIAYSPMKNSVDLIKHQIAVAGECKFTQWTGK